MLLIADAGGTKTDWALIREGKNAHDSTIFLQTDGINPSVMSEEDINRVLDSLNLKLTETLGVETEPQIKNTYFYGAGCNSAKTRNILSELLMRNVPNCEIKVISSDIEGAAIASLGNKAGIICILGTGSASALYDGKRITDSVPSLGYVLGDEGSGAFMGKMLLNCYFKREFPEYVNELIRGFKDISLTEVIENTYRKDKANKFLSSFMPFIKDHERNEEISSLIDFSLKLFFEKNVLKYKCRPADCHIGFVGGVAVAFEERLMTLSKEYGFIPMKPIGRPIDNLSRYFAHFNQI